MPSAVFILLHPNGTDLLMERRPPTDAHFPGAWLFPGGKLDAGETPEQALLRECIEELGCVPEAYEPLFGPGHPSVYYAREAVRSHRLYPYLVRQWAGEVPLRVRDSGAPLDWRNRRLAAHSEVPMVSRLAVEVLLATSPAVPAAPPPAASSVPAWLRGLLRRGTPA